MHKLLAGFLGFLLVSCAASGPQTYRLPWAEVTLPEGWVEGVSPFPKSFVAVRDDGDPFELFTITSARNPSPGISMSREKWSGMFARISSRMADKMAGKEQISNVKRVKRWTEWTQPYPRYHERLTFDATFNGQSVKASVSCCMIFTDQMVYTVALRENQAAQAADPGRFARLMGGFRD